MVVLFLWVCVVSMVLCCVCLLCLQGEVFGIIISCVFVCMVLVSGLVNYRFLQISRLIGMLLILNMQLLLFGLILKQWCLLNMVQLGSLCLWQVCLIRLLCSMLVVLQIIVLVVCGQLIMVVMLWQVVVMWVNVCLYLYRKFGCSSRFFGGQLFIVSLGNIISLVLYLLCVWLIILMMCLVLLVMLLIGKLNCVIVMWIEVMGIQFVVVMFLL